MYHGYCTQSSYSYGLSSSIIYTYNRRVAAETAAAKAAQDALEAEERARIEAEEAEKKRLAYVLCILRFIPTYMHEAYIRLSYVS